LIEGYASVGEALRFENVGWTIRWLNIAEVVAHLSLTEAMMTVHSVGVLFDTALILFGAIIESVLWQSLIDCWSSHCISPLTAPYRCVHHHAKAKLKP